ncbi:imelysin family protein [Marinospirillum insulare]|uniref:Imelysin-like domain-containing protein n=1 Tax=Marinospirillum insulare TaxID=217169 RepID=A0ABQ6A1L2_9GAMM|nr:imelysin family protein [Marinospirillum insulare]GLR64128.1 hypothetical protein GCM10007878_15660 [Marinospirillum insulare]
MSSLSSFSTPNFSTLGFSTKLTAKVSLIALALTAASQVLAAPNEQQWQAYNQAAINQQIIPSYHQLTQALENSEKKAVSLCKAPTSIKLVAAQKAYQQAMNQWQAVQHIQYGPVTLLMRNYGLHYWPDKRGTGANQLRSALALEDAVYDDQFFKSSSISLKGFPAMEKILFSKTAAKDLQPSSNACRFLTGVNHYMVKVAQEIEQDWQLQAERQLNPGANPYFETAAEAAIPLMKSLAEPLQVILDHKLDYPLGSGFEKARWSRSESWRSNQSLSNINTNLDALHQLYSGFKPVSVHSLLLEVGEKNLASSIESSFKQINKQLSKIPEVNQQDLTEKTDQALRQLRADIETLQNHLQLAMAALDVHLGFNSRDGD